MDHEPAWLPLLDALEPLGPRTRAKLVHLADDVLAVHQPAEDAALAAAHVHLDHIGHRQGQLGTSVDLLDLDPLVHHVLAAERRANAHAARRQIERRGHRHARDGARGGARRQQARMRLQQQLRRIETKPSELPTSSVCRGRRRELRGGRQAVDARTAHPRRLGAATRLARAQARGPAREQRGAGREWHEGAVMVRGRTRDDGHGRPDLDVPFRCMHGRPDLDVPARFCRAGGGEAQRQRRRLPRLDAQLTLGALEPLHDDEQREIGLIEYLHRRLDGELPPTAMQAHLAHDAERLDAERCPGGLEQRRRRLGLRKRAPVGLDPAGRTVHRSTEPRWHGRPRWRLLVDELGHWRRRRRLGPLPPAIDLGQLPPAIDLMPRRESKGRRWCAPVTGSDGALVGSDGRHSIHRRGRRATPLCALVALEATALELLGGGALDGGRLVHDRGLVCRLLEQQHPRADVSADHAHVVQRLIRAIAEEEHQVLHELRGLEVLVLMLVIAPLGRRHAPRLG